MNSDGGGIFLAFAVAMLTAVVILIIIARNDNKPAQHTRTVQVVTVTVSK